MRESSINWVGDLRAAVNCVSIYAAEGVSIFFSFGIHDHKTRETWIIVKRKATIYDWNRLLGMAVFTNFGNSISNTEVHGRELSEWNSGNLVQKSRSTLDTNLILSHFDFEDLR